jgi:ribonuclease P protein component
MRKRFRLRKNSDFQRVRREGRSWAHPLLILCVLRNDLGYSRFGFSASRRVGGAVVRNRAKRLMREATRLRQARIADGWDMVLIARQPMQEADFHQVDRAVGQLLRRACLLKTAENQSEKSLKVDNPLDCRPWGALGL